MILLVTTRGAWWTAVHGVSKSRTRLNDLPFTFHFHALEKEMATHSSGLAWRIPGMGEPGGLLSMGSHRVGHNWSNLAAAAAAEIALCDGCEDKFQTTWRRIPDPPLYTCVSLAKLPEFFNLSFLIYKYSIISQVYGEDEISSYI